MDTLDKHADTDGDDGAQQAHRVGKVLALTGAFLQLGFLIAIAGFINAAAEDHLREKEMLTDFRGILPFISGFVASFVGLVLLTIALLGTRYRARWFFWFLAIYGAVLTVAMPLIISAIFGVLIVGVIPFGPVFLIYCLVRRRDFFPRRRLRFV